MSVSCALLCPDFLCLGWSDHLPYWTFYSTQVNSFHLLGIKITRLYLQIIFLLNISKRKWKTLSFERQKALLLVYFYTFTIFLISKVMLQSRNNNLSFLFPFPLVDFCPVLHMISWGQGCTGLRDVQTWWSGCVFDSLHLILLPQLNRQQRKKGRGRMLLSVSKATQKGVTLLCHCIGKYTTVLLEKWEFRPCNCSTLSFAPRSGQKRR